MNGTIARALLEDAFQQVLDSRVFRLLLVLVCAFVSVFFVVGIREDGVHVLFGWKTLDYDQVLGVVGRSARGMSDPQGSVIAFVEGLLIESLAGNIAMIFCIAATAFFVPRMLEKGSADVLFSKPVARPMLLFSRWVSGVIFVVILASILLVGVWLGLLLVSGYNDPGILWGIVTLAYLYGIVHAFSITVGVLTRSTVAAILLSLMLFMGSGCVHSAWRFFEFNRETQMTKQLMPELEGDDGRAAEGREAAAAGIDGVLETLASFVAPMHYVLPKTSDADVLTKKLRRAIAGGPIQLVDEEGLLTVTRALDDLELRSPDPDSARGDRLEADLDSEPAVWEAVEAGRTLARIELRRLPRLQESAANGDNAGKRPRRITSAAAAERARERIRARVPEAGELPVKKETLGRTSASFLTWSEGSGERTARQLAVWTSGDWIFELEFEAEPAWAGADFRPPVAVRFLERIRPGAGNDAMDPASWYEKRFGWTSRWKYNAFFSIGSSLAFVLACFLVAHVKLGRMDL